MKGCGVLLVIVGYLSLVSGPLYAVPGTAPRPGLYAPVLTGKAVTFDLGGMEPDFDPLYHLVISATLHDPRPAGAALPDTLLVLSSYLEVFKPDTTPVLPDLLHPDQLATALGGFLQGKAALVNAAGRVAYRGGLLGEIFTNNTVHIVLRLSNVDEAATAPPLQLSGIFTLYKGGTQRGTLRASGPASLAALAVPRGLPVSWQSVIHSLAVAPPPMMGTAGQHQQTKQATCNVGTRLVACADQRSRRAVPPPIAPRRRVATALPQSAPHTAAQQRLPSGALAFGAAFLLVVFSGILWGRVLRGRATAGGPRTPAR